MIAYIEGEREAVLKGAVREDEMQGRYESKKGRRENEWAETGKERREEEYSEKE